MIRPSQLSPEYSVLDATKDIVFSWKSNIITQYGFQLLIYLNSDDTLIYDSTLQVSEETTYTLPNNSIENGLEVKYILKQYSNSETYIDSEYIMFKTALAPQVEINRLPTVTHEFEFLADVILDESAVIQKYKYLLFDNFDVVVYDSGYIYDYIPRHKLIGLLPNFPYKVQAEIVDSNGQSTLSNRIPFMISASTSSTVLFNAVPLNDFAAVQINFTPLHQTFGIVEGEYSFVNGKFGKGIKLEEDSFLMFEKDIPNTYSNTFYVKLSPDFVGDIVTLDGVYTIFYNGSQFGYRFGDFITIGKDRNIPSDSFMKIIFYYGKLIIQTVYYIEII